MPKTKTRPTTAAEFLSELDAAVLPVAAVCFRLHEVRRGSEIALSLSSALHKIDGVRDALRAEIKAQAEAAAMASAPGRVRWDGTTSKHD